MFRTIHTRLIAVALVAGLGLAAAAAPLTVDASGVPFSDGPSGTTVDLGWADGLSLVFGSANGLGVEAIIVDADAGAAGGSAVGRTGVSAEAVASGLVTDMRSGVVVTFDTGDLRDLLTTVARRLGDLGLQVSADADQPNVLHATNGTVSYRLVFTHVGGTAVRLYVGS
jgi:hypothetical protein